MKAEQLQPLADIVLKYNEFGSTVVLKNVTPAEVMFLVAMHHKNAGGDPVIRLKELPVDHEEKQAAPLMKELTEVNAKLEAVKNQQDIVEELREKRVTSFLAKIDSLEGQIQSLQATASIRFIGPSDERARLSFKYSILELEKFYPGAIPQLPKTFDEARSAGTRAKTSHETWLVGADKIAKAG